MRGIRGTDDILVDGVPQVAFVGRSNVGKSSLINALTNEKNLVKVGRKPGKTTEINFFHINRAFYLVDLPGYGYARIAPKDREKLKKLIIWYLSESGAKPALVVLVLDVKAGLTAFDRDMIMILTNEKHPYIIAVNKIDKQTQREAAQQVSDIKSISGDAELFLCSAETRKGVDAILEKISSVVTS
ncbi:ribosome biogenesis GTP-binding protein YihA/YsxC [Candidatus Kaiserbacteria bacterium]|nr:ribosome biogenesis GTP-binding protein YihA/YsxC [Candidatus Kaiserbacteria bacterium]